MQPGKPVAGYFRISKARDDMSAPDIYRDQINRYCDYKRWHVGEIFSDIDYSGRRDSKTRPGLEALKQRRYEFAAVVVPKLSRFGRSVRDLVQLFELFDRDGIALVFLDMNLDSSTSQGRLLRYVMAAFAEYESDVKSDYARANQDHRVRLGLPKGGPAPYGYVNSEKSLAIDPPRAAVVSEVFRRVVAGESRNAIARDLNDRGIATSGGARWLQSTITVVLDNPAYAGLLPHRGELLPGAWEPIVSRETWERAAALRAPSKRSSVNTRRHQNHHLLYGLIHCGVCGRRLHHRPHGRSSIYACPTSRINALGKERCPGGTIGAPRAEQLVTAAFHDRFWFAFSDDVRHKRMTSLEAAWNAGNVDDRRELLASRIDRVEVLPRRAGQPDRGKLGRRELKIVWRGDVTTEARSSELIPDELKRKTCSRCRERKPLEEFNANRGKSLGRSGWCRACDQEQERRLRPKKRNSYFAEWRRWQEAHHPW